MRHLFLFAILGLFCFCAGSYPEPQDLLTEDKMVAILLDINIAEGGMKARYVLGDSAKALAPYLYDHIYDKHGVSRDQFDRNLDYYLHQPGKMDKIYEQVITELSIRESEGK